MSLPADAVPNYGVSRGSSSVNVGVVQGLLNFWGANPQLDIDDDFGPLTETQVRFFQGANKLVVDGVVGPQTSAALQDDSSVPILSTSTNSPPDSAAATSHTGLIVGLGVAGTLAAGGALVVRHMRKRRS